MWLIPCWIWNPILWLPKNPKYQCDWYHLVYWILYYGYLKIQNINVIDTILYMESHIVITSKPKVSMWFILSCIWNPILWLPQNPKYQCDLYYLVYWIPYCGYLKTQSINVIDAILYIESHIMVTSKCNMSMWLIPSCISNPLLRLLIRISFLCQL